MIEKNAVRGCSGNKKRIEHRRRAKSLQGTKPPGLDSQPTQAVNHENESGSYPLPLISQNGMVISKQDGPYS